MVSQQPARNWNLADLESVALIQTGLAMGKKNIVDPVTMPYIRVANVQDGYLDLSEVKEIDVDRSLVERYSIHQDDVLLTEGGDFDKLGRGTIWNGEIPNCLHQNHVFVVRTNPEKLNPRFFSYLS